MTFIDGRSIGKVPDYSGITKTSISNFIDKGKIGLEGGGPIENKSMFSGTPKVSPEEGLKIVNHDQNQLQAQSDMIRNQLGI